MRFSVSCDGSTIGHSDLEHCDHSMGVAFGAFTPTEGYQRAQSVFRLFVEEKHQEYYRTRDALNLQLNLDGTRMIPTSCIHIVDHSVEFGIESMQLEVHLSDSSTVKELFPV
jgi:hypothetical protein